MNRSNARMIGLGLISIAGAIGTTGRYGDLGMFIMVGALFLFALEYLVPFLWSGVKDEEDGQECPGCGYSLTGNTSGRCPECGMPLKHPAPPVPPPPQVLLTERQMGGSGPPGHAGES